MLTQNNYNKQKTLSEKRNKFSKKSTDKSSIKKSVTKTSRWSHYFRSTQKGGQQSPGRSKTIEKKFTMSSSISSIRCLSKKRENQAKTSVFKGNFAMKASDNASTIKKKNLNKKLRFEALSLNIKRKVKNQAQRFSSLKYNLKMK